MAHYNVYTDNGLTTWVVTGAGSGGRISDFQDDTSPTPNLANSNGVWFKITGGTAWPVANGDGEYEYTLTTEPDGDNGDDQTVYDHQNDAWLVRGTAGSLNEGEWDWAAGTLYVRLTDDDDPDGGDTYVYYAWSNFWAETIPDRIYMLYKNLEIGDGSISTTLNFDGEHVYCDNDVTWQRMNNANVDSERATFSWGHSAETALDLINTNATTGTLSIQGSHLHLRGSASKRIDFREGTVTLDNCILSSEWDGDAGDSTVYYFEPNINSLSITNTTFYNVNYVAIYKSGTFSNLVIDSTHYGLLVNATGVVVDGVEVKNFDGYAYMVFSSAGARDLGLTNPVTKPTDANVFVYAASASGDDHWLKWYEDITLNFVKEDGTAFDDEVTVTVDYTTTTDYDTELFSEATSSGSVSKTGVNGMLLYMWRQYNDGGGDTNGDVDYRPYRITASAPGYETKIIDSLQPADAIDWTIMLRGPTRHKVGSNTYFKDDS